MDKRLKKSHPTFYRSDQLREKKDVGEKPTRSMTNMDYGKG